MNLELCKFPCVHLLASNWFKNKQLLSKLTHAHYRDTVRLNVRAQKSSITVQRMWLRKITLILRNECGRRCSTLSAMFSPSPSSFAVTCSPANILQHLIGKTTHLTIFKKIFVCKIEPPLAGKRRSICMKTKSKTSRFSANRRPSNLIG